MPGEPVERAHQEIQEILDALGGRDPALRARLTLQNVAPAMEIAADQPVVGAVRRAAEAVLGRDPGVHGWTATADSNMLVNDLGIPTVIFGPGSIRQVAHQPNEYVPISELHAATQIYALVLADLLGRGGLIPVPDYPEFSHAEFREPLGARSRRDGGRTRRRPPDHLGG